MNDQNDIDTIMKKLDEFNISDVLKCNDDEIKQIMNEFNHVLNLYPKFTKYWIKYIKTMFIIKEVDDIELHLKNLILEKLKYSINIWTEYLKMIKENGDNSYNKRLLYSFVLDNIGWHYKSGPLWEEAIEYERSFKRCPSFYYLKLIQNPIEDVDRYYYAFLVVLNHVTTERIGELLNNLDSSLSEYAENSNDVEKQEIFTENNDIRANLLKQIEEIYNKTKLFLQQISHFEKCITREYFHPIVPDSFQILNWENYCEFLKNMYYKGDKSKGLKDFIIKTYERSLFPLAAVDDIYISYTDFLSSINESPERIDQVFDSSPKVCFRTRIQRFVFAEHMGNTDLCESLFNTYIISEYLDYVIAALYYRHRNPDGKPLEEYFNNAINRFSNDHSATGVLASIYTKITKIPNQSAIQSDLLDLTNLEYLLNKQAQNSLVANAYQKAVQKNTPANVDESKRYAIESFICSSRAMGMTPQYLLDFELYLKETEYETEFYNSIKNMTKLIKQHKRNEGNSSLG